MRSRSSGLVKLCIKTKFRGNGGGKPRQERAMGKLTNRITMPSQAEHDETQRRSFETRGPPFFLASALRAVQIAVALPLRKDGLAYHRSRKQQKALLYRSSLHYQVRKQRVCGEK
ncbi:hypothetical protein [Pedobacter namyangjuensis]|uniref:hypothetical protein n=1 Tax=Pedobacter namyangjuensis TaxID=600626 RepID=UPI000DE3482A|nr:hypothetical protein [Pedobacter namyangjuensis]